MNRNLHAILILTTIAWMPLVTQAQSVDEVFEGMIDTENAGYRSVENYLLETETMGMSTVEYYEKTSSLTLDNGQTVYIMRNVPPNEIQERHSGGNAMSNASPEELRNAALAIEDAGRQMEAGMLSEMEGVGLPGGIGDMLMNPPADEPWLSPNPRDMTSMYATMLNAAAKGKEEQANEDPVGDAQRQAQSMAAIQAQTRIVGRRVFNGIDAIEMAATDLDYTQSEDGQQVTWNSASMLVDANRFVPLLFTMDGTITDGKKTRPMTMEREDMDYRNVPGCGDMYRPFKSVMRLGGAMTPEQQAELAEASVQLEEMEAQMASMPPDQRKMMESMLGPQLDMIRNMASGGRIEIESSITKLRCNTGLPDPLEMAGSAFGVDFGGAAAAGGATRTGGTITIDSDADLLKMIQLDLVKLDYAPGNTNGILDKPTSVAISQFQVSKGMEVTGLPSPQLAGILQAAVGGASGAAGSSNTELTADYLAGDWCTERMQERELYSFAADGTYRVGVLGMTITQMDGINYLPETYIHQEFLDKFQSVVSKDQDRFTVVLNGGSQETLLRGNCFR